jgi:hypothetical protein
MAQLRTIHPQAQRHDSTGHKEPSLAKASQVLLAPADHIGVERFFGTQIALKL